MTALPGYTANLPYLADRGGPASTGCAASPRTAPGTVVTLRRRDASGSQAQVVLAEPDGERWYLLTLAAQDGDRGPELQQVLLELVRGATVA